MPIPKPKENETQKDFIARCMGDEVMRDEYPENDKRAAICYSAWRKKKMDVIIQRKSFSGIDLKDAEKGSFVAKIATLEVADKDNDVTLPGAFPPDAMVLVSAYQHGSWMGGLPVGKAIIKEIGRDVLAEGQFNLASANGREHYETIKFAPELQEWSYGFKALEFDLDADWQGQKVARILRKVLPVEISPVMRGAGVDTATLAIKGEGLTIVDQTEAVLAAVSDWVGRIKSLADLRRQDGRKMSGENMARMEKLMSQMDDMRGMMEQIMGTEEENSGKALKLFLEWQKLQSELLEV